MKKNHCSDSSSVHWFKIRKSEVVEDLAENEPLQTSGLLIEWNWGFFEVAMMFLALLIGLSIVILLLQSKLLKSLTKLVPMSGMIIFSGILMGVLARLGLLIWINNRPYMVSENLMEQVLIIPIILHASYRIYHPHFLGQIGTILVMAFLGTLANVVIISLVLYYGYNPTEDKPDLSSIIRFSSLISAVVQSLFCVVIPSGILFLGPSFSLRRLPRRES